MDQLRTGSGQLPDGSGEELEPGAHGTGHPGILELRPEPSLGSGAGAVCRRQESDGLSPQGSYSPSKAVRGCVDKVHATDDGMNGSPPCQLLYML